MARKFPSLSRLTMCRREKCTPAPSAAAKSSLSLCLPLSLSLCRTIGDGVFALDNICTHALARLSEGRLRGTRLICPLHGASFDVRDGRVLGAPATRPLATHALRIVDGGIEISVAPSVSKQPAI